MTKKFRAYYKPHLDKGIVEMFEQVERDNKLYFVSSLNDEVIYDFYIPFIDDDWVVEETIGLKDKNGKEIYDGDIVKYQDEYYSEVFGQGKVYYDGDDCMFKIRCVGFILFFINLSNEELEVVGNIHDKEKEND